MAIDFGLVNYLDDIEQNERIDVLRQQQQQIAANTQQIREQILQSRATTSSQLQNERQARQADAQARAAAFMGAIAANATDEELPAAVEDAKARFNASFPEFAGTLPEFKTRQDLIAFQQSALSAQEQIESDRNERKFVFDQYKFEEEIAIDRFLAEVEAFKAETDAEYKTGMLDLRSQELGLKKTIDSAKLGIDQARLQLDTRRAQSDVQFQAAQLNMQRQQFAVTSGLQQNQFDFNKMIKTQELLQKVDQNRMSFQSAEGKMLADIDKLDKQGRSKEAAQLKKKLQQDFETSVNKDIKQLRELTFNQDSKLRTEYLKASETFSYSKRYYDIIQSYVGDPTAAGQTSLMYSIMKMVNPGEALNDGDLAVLRQGETVLNNIKTQYNRIINTNKPISQDQVDDILRTADNIYRTRVRGQQVVEARYTDLAKEYGLNPNTAVPSLINPVRRAASSALIDLESAASIQQAPSDALWGALSGNGS